MGQEDFTSFPDSLDGVQAVNLLNAKWPSGSNLDLSVVVTRADDAATKDGIQRMSAAILTIPGLSGPPTTNISADGHVAFIAGLVFDATTRHRLEEQLVQSQKMESLGRLAGGVAHDFNNLLTAMIGFCDLLLLRSPPSDPSFADIMQIKQNANRAANLVRQLLASMLNDTGSPELAEAVRAICWPDTYVIGEAGPAKVMVWLVKLEVLTTRVFCTWAAGL